MPRFSTPACGHLARETISAFRQSIADLGITAPLYITQNDGTLMSADYAEQYPVLTFASGPTNSMRGAAFLSGLKDAMVVDVGGTTSDVGALTHGFPREASVAVDIGGVRTNFRMPDVYSFGLGGGSLVREDPLRVGPQSVGYRITEEALVFGGETLTTTDVAVAAGAADIGDAERVTRNRPESRHSRPWHRIQEMTDAAVDRMKTSAEPIPVIIVGGGSILIASPVAGASEMVKPDHFEAANAVGAAIAQISGEVDRVYALAIDVARRCRGGRQGGSDGEGGRRRSRPGNGPDRRRRGRAARLPAGERHAHPCQSGRRSGAGAAFLNQGELPGGIMRQISADALDDIARGAAVLGTGGGGDPYIGKLMAQGTLRRCGDVDLLDPMELADDDIVVPTAMMGAPTVMVEKIPRGEEIVNAFKALQTYLGQPVRATMSMRGGRAQLDDALHRGRRAGNSPRRRRH